MENAEDRNPIEVEMNAKILKLTLRINELYPELTKYIEEMQETVPLERKEEDLLKDLTTYHDSLNSMLNKYTLKHPVKL